MRSRTLVSFVAITFGSIGCGHTRQAAPTRPATLGGSAAAAAYHALLSTSGPDRFAQVTPSLYRGGQPTASQLALLRDLGVRTIITFIGDRTTLRAETDAAARLGLTVHDYPFNGLSTPDPALLRRVIAELRGASLPVYVHCRQGRDRTSLVVALYRVWVDGWDPDVAWQREALDFGHGGVRALFFRKLDRAYARLSRQATRE
jgi:protein tyrosine/serine phosphatase